MEGQSSLPSRSRWARCSLTGHSSYQLANWAEAPHCVEWLAATRRSSRLKSHCAKEASSGTPFHFNYPSPVCLPCRVLWRDASRRRVKNDITTHDSHVFRRLSESPRDFSEQLLATIPELTLHLTPQRVIERTFVPYSSFLATPPPQNRRHTRLATSWATKVRSSKQKWGTYRKICWRI